LFAGFGLGQVRQVQGGFVNQFLFVQQDKFPFATEHAPEGIGELLRWFDASLVNAVHDLTLIALVHVATDKFPELEHIPFEKNRGFVQVFLVKRVADDLVFFVIVEVSAGVEADAFFADGFAEILEQGRVGPGLVGGVAGFVQALPQGGDHNPAFVGFLGAGPLLEFHDHHLRLVILVGSR